MSQLRWNGHIAYSENSLSSSTPGPVLQSAISHFLFLALKSPKTILYKGVSWFKLERVSSRSSHKFEKSSLD